MTNGSNDEIAIWRRVAVIGIVIVTHGVATTMTMKLIAMTDGGPDLQGETGVCHPVTGIQDGADTKMKIATVVMTATTGTETVTGIVTIAGIVIEMEIGNESVTGTEIGIGTAADGIVMMIAIVAQGILRRIHRVDIVIGIGSETVIATPAGEGETRIDELGKTWPAFHLSIS